MFPDAFFKKSGTVILHRTKALHTTYGDIPISVCVPLVLIKNRLKCHSNKIKDTYFNLMPQGSNILWQITQRISTCLCTMLFFVLSFKKYVQAYSNINKYDNILVRFEVFTSVTKKDIAVWDIRPSLYVTRNTLRRHHRPLPANAFWDIRTQFVHHRKHIKHITSPLQAPTSKGYVRFEVYTAIAMHVCIYIYIYLFNELEWNWFHYYWAQ
jgi:hypothetical protein